eukprot:TRINITY_DN1299_c0_g2_i1.p1 TRINITY_DN1299_c0_g2~~TRINITY_DN1299_c0_g2_i1.p1  ORF type:complete len:2014 (+),score=509.93 TRINITY_DN1299_c0_g2_i1:1-6042(+)
MERTEAKYKSFWTKVCSGLKMASYKNPQRHLEAGIKALKDVNAGNDFEGEKKYFLKKQCSITVSRMMMRDVQEEDVKRLFSDFLREVILVLISEMNEGLVAHNVVCNPLFSLFNLNAKLYYKNGKEDIDSDIKAQYYSLSSNDPNCYAIMPKGVSLSRYIVIHINFFGAHGGFDKLLDIYSTYREMEMSLLKTVLRPLYTPYHLLNPVFLESCLPEIADYVFEKLMEVTMENKTLKGSKLASFNSISGNMGRLLEVIWTKEQVVEKVEGFNLRIGLINFSQDTLEPRLRGLQKIIECIQKTKKEKKSVKDQLGGMFQRKQEDETPVIHIEPEFIYNWMDENDVIDRYFDMIYFHIEILRQGAELLNFLASIDMLNKSHLDIIWDGSLGIHESSRRIVYDTLLNLTSVISLDLVDYLLEKVYSTPIKSFDMQMLELVQKMTSILVKADSDKKYYALQVFWKLLQKDAKVDVNIVDKAYELLLSLLSDDCKNKRREYIQLCAQNMDTRSILLLKELLESYPTKKKKRSGAIEELQRENLLDLFFEELREYKLKSQELFDELEEEIDIENFLVGRKYTHLENLQIRLDLLDFIVSNSSINLTIENIDNLWGQLMTEQLHVLEGELFLVWLQKLSDNGSFGEEIMEYVFTSKMQEIDSSLLSSVGFSVFERFFIAINEKEGNIKSTGDDYGACSTEIFGIESMWDIALKSENREVNTAAINSLNRLFISVESFISNKTKASKVMEEHVRKCMDQIDLDDLYVTEKSLLILKNFIQSYDERKQNEDEAEKNQEKKPGREIEVYWCSTTSRARPVTVYSNTTIGEFKEMAIRELDFEPSDYLKVSISQNTQSGFSRKELKENNKTMADYKIEKDTKFLFSRVYADAEIFDDVPVHKLMLGSLRHAMCALGIGQESYNILRKKLDEKEKTVSVSKMRKGVAMFRSFKNRRNESNDESEVSGPRKILTDYFDHLYDLLSSPNEIAENVWEILNMIPKSDSIINKFQSLTEDIEKNWDDYLDQDNLYKLVYNLEVIEIIIKLERENQQKNDWMDNFISGVERLISSLLSIEIDGKASFKAFCQILRTISLVSIDDGVGHRPTINANLIGGKKVQSKLIKKLIDIIYNCSLLGTHNNEFSEGELIKESMTLLVPLSMYSKRNVKRIFEMDNLEDWIITMVLKSPCEKVRSEGVKGLSRFIREITRSEYDYKSPSTYFFNMIFEVLPLVEEYRDSCDQYFQFLNNLLLKYEGNNRVTLLQGFIHKLIATPVTETDDSEYEDKVLVGTILLITALVKQDPSLKERCLPLIEEVFRNCLFSPPDVSNSGGKSLPKCKVVRSREAAFKLLAELARGSPVNFRVLLSLLQDQIEDIDTGDAPVKNVRKKSTKHYGYLGLKNQGCTCYMNSTIQQLYLIPEFRQALLTVKDNSEDLEDSMLFQLQTLFAHLQESEKRYYDPISFCKTYKDFDGQPVNLMEQQDANEFFNVVFDKLEGILQDDREYALRNIFQGQFCNQLIGQNGCTHYRERLDPFYTISVEIKNNPTLEDALRSFIIGETLSGDNQFYCEDCDQKVDTLKRCCIEEIPPILFIHLKRFEFDYINMRNVKLYDECSFPQTLNLEPYTREGIAKREAERDNIEFDMDQMNPPDYYNYELKGVVIHSGSTESGHYYSYIKERVPIQGNENKWFEFNDTSVTPFYIDELEEECFGGSYETWQWADRMRTQKKKVLKEKSHSGYILVYERISDTEERGRKINSMRKEAMLKMRGQQNDNRRAMSTEDVTDSGAIKRREKLLGSNPLRKSRSRSNLISSNSANLIAEHQAAKKKRKKKRKKRKKKDNIDNSDEEPKAEKVVLNDPDQPSVGENTSSEEDSNIKDNSITEEEKKYDEESSETIKKDDEGKSTAEEGSNIKDNSITEEEKKYDEESSETIKKDDEGKSTAEEGSNIKDNSITEEDKKDDEESSESDKKNSKSKDKKRNSSMYSYNMSLRQKFLSRKKKRFRTTALDPSSKLQTEKLTDLFMEKRDGK